MREWFLFCREFRKGAYAGSRVPVILKVSEHWFSFVNRKDCMRKINHTQMMHLNMHILLSLFVDFKVLLGCRYSNTTTAVYPRFICSSR